MRLLIALGIVSTCTVAASTCQPSSDPDRLITSIIGAQKQSALSTDVLRLMLPCPGSKASTASLTALLNANFSEEQLQLVTAAFVFPTPNLSDLVAFAKTSADPKTKEQIVKTRLKIVPRDLEQVNWRGMTAEQTRFLSDHVVLQAREAELGALMSYPTDDSRSTIFRFRLFPMVLTTPQAVRALARYQSRADLTQKFSLSIPISGQQL